MVLNDLIKFQLVSRQAGNLELHHSTPFEIFPSGEGQAAVRLDTYLNQNGSSYRFGGQRASGELNPILHGSVRHHARMKFR